MKIRTNAKRLTEINLKTWGQRHSYQKPNHGTLIMCGRMVGRFTNFRIQASESPQARALREVHERNHPPVEFTISLAPVSEKRLRALFLGSSDGPIAEKR